jgi:exopolysaccharide biosynthesis polyprenyl glycosylphosphotransferase
MTKIGIPHNIKLMSGLKKAALFIGDITILYASLATTLFIRYWGLSPSSYFAAHLKPFSIIFVIWLLVFYISDLYRHGAFRSRGVLFSSIVRAVFISGILSVIVFYIFGGIFDLTPKTNLLIFAIVFLVFDYFWRSTIFGIFRSGATNIVVLGDSKLIKETVTYLSENQQAGYKVVEWFGNFGEAGVDMLVGKIKNGDVELVVVQPRLTTDSETVNSLYNLLPLGMNLMSFSDFYEMIFEKVPLEEVEEGWFVEHIAPRRPAYDRAKRLADLMFSFVLGLILLPFALIVAVLIKFTSSGAIIYKQKRAGRGGKLFTLYKFRSMAENHNGPLWTEMGDSRITGIGRLIRFTHLDEIPQLWNIFRGDISLVGPRPERIELAEEYSQFPYYEIRHVVTPGLTGWAQTHFKASASLEEGFEKLKYDIYYVQNRSFLLDILILLKTVKYFFVNHN